MNYKKIEIASVVTRLFTNAAGRTVDVKEKVKCLGVSTEKCNQILNKIEDIYGFKIVNKNNSLLTLEQIVDKCYEDAREKALAKIKSLVLAYGFTASDIHGHDMDSIH